MTARKLGLALCDADNPYEQALEAAARETALRRRLEVLPTHWAGSSAVEQLSGLFGLQRQGMDGCVLLAVGPDLLSNASEGLLRAGLSLAFLNRQPSNLAELQRRYPEVTAFGVAPDQVQIGRLQGEQALRLAPAGGVALLVTGTEETSSTHDRRAGFRKVVEGKLKLLELEGRWTSDAAEKALGRWFKVGAARRGALDVVVCQNDAMALGVRRALVAEAAAGRPELARLPVTGVDGLPQDGQRRVREGELAATIVMPLTSTQAVDALADFWGSGSRSEQLVLASQPYPPLAALKRPPSS